MKRLITYIKNLFGADERLRMWCVEQANKLPLSLPAADMVKYAESYYKWITRKEPVQSAQEHHGNW